MRHGLGSTRCCWAAALVALAAGCDGDGGLRPVPDGPPDGPVDFALGAGPDNDDPFTDMTVHIAGMAFGRFERYRTTFPDRASFLAAELPLELMAGAQVVDRVLVRTRDFYPCGQDSVDERLYSFAIGYCAYGHGELRFGGTDETTDRSGCTADGFCLPCGGQCRPGTRCTSTFADAALTYSRLECVAPGQRALGEPCSWSPRADGRWLHDCADGALCVAGTCRRQCGALAGTPCGLTETCVRPPGHAPELRVCQPT